MRVATGGGGRVRPHAAKSKSSVTLESGSHLLGIR